MKRDYIIIAIIAAVLAVGWLMISQPWRNTEEAEEAKEEQKQESQQNNQTPQEGEKNVWIGELKKSNDPSRGNLMLFVKDSDRVIYIRTIRDYSQLIGKQVKTLYEGDLTSFKLIDIIAQ